MSGRDLEKETIAFVCGYDQSRECVCPLALFKVFGGLSPLQRSKVRQTFVGVVVFPLFFFFLLPCYLNFQTSALMSIVGTSRGLLAHRQVLVLVRRRESPHSSRRRDMGPTHSFPNTSQGRSSFEVETGVLTPACPGPRAYGGWLAVGRWVCSRTFSLSEGICLPSVAEERLSNSRVLRFH